MAIAPIGGIADVANSVDDVLAEWGNAVGASSVGRVVHRFNSTAERDAAIPQPTRGMVCVTVDTDTVWQAVGAAPAKWRAGLTGAVVAHGSLGPASAGMPADGYVNCITSPSFTTPGPTTVKVHATVWYGNQGAGWINGQADLLRRDLNQPIGLTPLSQWAVVGAWGPIPLHQSWDVAAGADCGFTLRYNQAQHQSANGWYNASCTYQVVNR